MDKYDEDQQVTMAELQKELKKAVSGFTDAGGTKNDLENFLMSISTRSTVTIFIGSTEYSSNQALKI